MVTDSGATDLYSPGGVQSAPFYNIAQQGVLQAEASPTDLAISGGGFFVVNSSSAGTGTESFTRAGDFNVDANGNLVNSAGPLFAGPAAHARPQAQAIQGGNFAQLTATSVSSLQTVNVAEAAPAPRSRQPMSPWSPICPRTIPRRPRDPHRPGL